jgi:carbamoyltransferase
MTKILGISEGSHDAAWCLINNNYIIEAHHAERHSRKKNDKWINKHLLPQGWFNVVGHEDKVRVNERRLFAGQKYQDENVIVDQFYNHYETHAWAGWATAPFDDCDILCIDAIGEFESAAAYSVRNKVFTKTWEMAYPQSLGLIYSAVTHGLGYKPMEEEYIVMGLAAYGEPTIDFEYLMDENCHKGIKLPNGRPEDIAASVQALYEKHLLILIDKYCKHKNLILMGGCALNCVANSKIQNKNIWIMPNPGDAGSSLGAAARQLNNKLKWRDPYLGTDIQRPINPNEVARYLIEHGVAGVANGRAEFGPRALGNRSLLADPRLDIRDTVNEIKRRQKFRPFAPAILEEYANEYFEGPMNEYMQFVAKAKHDYKSVTHVDGTARVQIVKPNCQSVIRPILEEWYELTGCPMLLNTSLNIKGQPMVDTWENAEEFENKYKVKVF